MDYIIIFNKIPLRFGIKLFGKDSITSGKKVRWEGFIFGGLDFLYRPTITPKVTYMTTIHIDSVRSINYISELGTSARFGLHKTFGFMLKSYYKKGAIINFSVAYSYSRRGQLSYLHYYFKDSNNNEYHNSETSNGNGLYFTLGAEININKNIQRVKKMFNNH